MAKAIQEEVATSVLWATCTVRDTYCALDAGKVQEVIRLGAVTPVPHAPQAVMGIVNLRGRIVTILDVGLLLGFDRIVPTNECRIFIVSTHGEFVGLLVDSVGEVVEVQPQTLESASSGITGIPPRFVEGVYRLKNHVSLLLNSEELLREDN